MASYVPESYTASIKKMIVGEGGFVAYLGTNDAYEVETKAKEGSKVRSAFWAVWHWFLAATALQSAER